MNELKSSAKPFEMSKWEVWQAYQKVKANKGAPGVDGMDLAAFETDLQSNLYKIWNRMSSGSYFPSGACGGDTETAWRRHEGARGAYDRGQDRPNSGSWEAAGKGRADLSSRLLWLSPGAVAVGCGPDMPGALLEI